MEEADRLDDDQDDGWVNVSSGNWLQTKGHKTIVVVIVVVVVVVIVVVLMSSCVY